MMWPYFISAVVIAVFTFSLTNFVIPKSNLKRIDFEDKYYRPSNRRVPVENIHRQVAPNVLLYMGSYNPLAGGARILRLKKLMTAES